ncbi:peptidylprolyl isomerase [Pseudemcibacter aquimaris]|uniref:peptidylprolyl isomerase n=1 Tax=Pseudemcibacter aquimaris TaxID=2857064 RepID=UPI0020116FB8|nr:peptidylprolyl isomerase [Pseudemcibacter aquimaris]MCC3859960.1 peptidylprolyl isomerase [Pseudemcibacter aquimaris]WDU57292.1 peptidylprolyl isomerase [Pseudemcibacter aquimaris]
MTMINYKKHIRNLLIASAGFSLFSTQSLFAQQQAQLDDVQEIVALVNDDLISVYDLRQRALLLMLFSGRTTVSGEQQAILQNQAMNALIDDHLKLQEASEYDAVMDNAQLEGAFENYAAQVGITGEQLEQQLELAGIKKSSLLFQLNGTISWQGVVNGLLEPQVNITDDEVYNAIETLEQNRGKDEYRVSEIFLLVTNNEAREESIATANAIYQQLQAEAPFNAMAQQFSQSSTSAVGGDMGWVMETEIPVEVRDKILSMEKGEISEPVITEDGIYILQVTDQRKILTVTEDDNQVNLVTMFFEQEEESEQFANDLNNKLQAAYGDENFCTNIEANAASIGGGIIETIGGIRVGDLNPGVKEQIIPLDTNEGTNVIREEGGYRSFVVCGKSVAQEMNPDFDTILDNMTRTRLQLFARRHLRDLRRDAIIDYR